MAKREHVKILWQGAEQWNRWRKEHRKTAPDLHRASLGGANLCGANLFGVSLRDAHIGSADLRCANLYGADLGGANLRHADLGGANLRHADLGGADLGGADLGGANLGGAYLGGANLDAANLDGANFTDAKLGYCSFGDNDLSRVRGLETTKHTGPSTIGIDTLYKSSGNIPEAFLRGCGVPEDFITFIPSHFGIQQAIQFYSCFISYSHKDEDFAHRLYSRMRDSKLRVWYAPEEMKGGEKLHEQIFRAIQLHDRLLLVLSESSLQSEWVMTEIRRARKAEREEGRRKLFPIRLVDFDALQEWECFDADGGKDLAVELREYFIPDFSNWKDHDAFEKAFDRLIRDLKAEEKKA